MSDPFADEAATAAMTPEQKERHERSQLKAAFSPYGELFFPGDAIAPILTPHVRGALTAWMIEMNSAAALKKVGLTPRSRAMLSGPPGCGKTTLAHHVAARIGLPLLVVQSTQVVSQYVGATGGQIGKLFRAARQDKGKVAIFFDEFDSLATKRSGNEQAASKEFNNITIALLQEIDRFDGMLYAATNRPKDIDSAIWRRFQMQIEIGFPGQLERFAIVKLYMAPFAIEDAAVEALVDALDGASPALIKECCESIKRALILGPKLNLPTDLRSMLLRFAASAAPADGQPVPVLWDAFDDVVDRVTSAPWPPELAA